MKIYIASSWKNQHAVELLTAELRRKNHVVLSFVENNQEHAAEKENQGKDFDFTTWVWSKTGKACFEFDSSAAMDSDAVIYIGPSGKDSAVEIGMAYGCGVPILGLWAKGEDLGLMRRVVTKWHDDFRDLLQSIEELAGEVVKR